MKELTQYIKELRLKMKRNWDRHVSIPDLLSDRWETASFYGFVEGTSCYNNSVIIGDVKVGKNTWIGPNTVLDGKGGLIVGDFCAISAGVQIYTHHAVKWSNSLGEKELEYAPTQIGNGVFIGPNTVIQMGVCIGDGAVIGAMSFVNKSVPANRRWYGNSLID